MNGCLFCRIIAKEIPAAFEYESDSLVAIRDINPQAPVHLLVVPKKHIERISQTDKSEAALLGEMIICAKEIAKQRGLKEGFRLVLNDGAIAGQSVFHIHLHLLGGREMAWPPG
jgi:histidine triad (HIT) family protein